MASPRSIFLPYQQKWMADRASVKVYEKSRRIGITWAEAADCALTAATTGRAGDDVWYIGYNKEMALEFVEDAADWARRWKHAAEAIEETIIEDENKDILAYRIRFASGHKISALSSRPANLRGKQGIAVIDEAAFHENLPELLKAALAFTIWGGRVHVISTHNGDVNPFNDLVNDIRAGRLPYALHRTSFDDALGEGLYHAICKAQSKAWTHAAQTEFRARVYAEYGDKASEELDCVPSGVAGTYLPAALIESVMRDNIPVLRWELPYSFMTKRGGELEAEAWCETTLLPEIQKIDKRLMTCFGEDFGRSGDLTVIWPLVFMPNLIRATPFIIEMRNVPFREQEHVLFYLADRLPRLIAGAMDARGNGQFLAEEAGRRYGFYDPKTGALGRIENVMLSQEWYRDNMPRYKAAFEDGKITLPRDSEVFADHRAFVMEKGIAKIPERRTSDSHGNQRHGDSGIAGALAYYASTLSPREYGYQPVAKAPGRFDERPDDDNRLRDFPDHREDAGNLGQRIKRAASGWFGH